MWPLAFEAVYEKNIFLSCSFAEELKYIEMSQSKFFIIRYEESSYHHFEKSTLNQRIVSALIKSRQCDPSHSDHKSDVAMFYYYGCKIELNKRLFVIFSKENHNHPLTINKNIEPGYLVREVNEEFNQELNELGAFMYNSPTKRNRPRFTTFRPPRWGRFTISFVNRLPYEDMQFLEREEEIL